MYEKMYVIATRGKQGKEIYLKCTEKEIRVNGNKINTKILCEWTDNIEDAIATFTYSDIEYTANNYFTNYKKWYIKEYNAKFN